MRNFAIVALCGVALVACNRENPARRAPKTTTVAVPSDVRNAKVNEVIARIPPFMDHSLLGPTLAPDGTVKGEDPAAVEGTPLYLTVWFRESPPGLQTAAVVTTMDKKPVHTERREMNGAKVATFALGNHLKPGRYKVTAYWGGNFATDREFEIIRRNAAPKRTK
jgi:hypothetical protein